MATSGRWNILSFVSFPSHRICQACLSLSYDW